MKTSEIKKKVADKVIKSKAKIASKCAKATAVILFAVACGGVVTGCATAEAPTAQRAQSITAEDVNVVVNLNMGTATNAVCDTTNTIPVNVNVTVEIATAAQANDTGGAETMTTTADQKPTTDVKPTTNFTYGLCSTGAGNDWIAELTYASAKGLASWLRSGNANGKMTVTKKDGTTDTVTCKDGKCYPSTCSECVTCKDGDCTPCDDCAPNE